LSQAIAVVHEAEVQNVASSRLVKDHSRELNDLGFEVFLGRDKMGQFDIDRCTFNWDS